MFPSLPSIPKIPNLSSLQFDNPIQGVPTTKNVFQNLMSKVSEEINMPHKLAEEMMAGKKPFDSTELVVSLVEAERKLSLTVRTITDIVKGLKNMEAITA